MPPSLIFTQVILSVLCCCTNSQLDSPLVPNEIKQFRSISGALQWLVAQRVSVLGQGVRRALADFELWAWNVFGFTDISLNLCYE